MSEVNGLKIKIKPFVIPASFMVFCIFNIETVISGMQKALSICAFSIVPSLFIFMVLSDLTLSLMLNDNSLSLTPKMIAFILGALCGFPIGAIVCERLHKSGAISESDTKKLLPYCNNASPAFVIGAIGVSMLGDKNLGILLYFSQLIISFIPICFIKCTDQKNLIDNSKSSVKELFFSAIEKSVYGIFKVCAIICFFTALLSIIEHSKLSLLAPILEISCGSSFAASLYGTNPVLSVLVCGFCVGFSGICVHLQMLSAVKSIKINYVHFLIVKTLQGIVCALISLLGYELFFLS